MTRSITKTIGQTCSCLITKYFVNGWKYTQARTKKTKLHMKMNQENDHKDYDTARKMRKKE